ncbi:hypothetical protein, partial [Bacteriovorax sp. DB6_IX]|uniref:hypothetical protein n=1 Tax=Bacteriovorax sp. DB6_IX TaxID=1353530 RepID=UPI00038A4917
MSFPAVFVVMGLSIFTLAFRINRKSIAKRKAYQNRIKKKKMAKKPVKKKTKKKVRKKVKSKLEKSEDDLSLSEEDLSEVA